LLALDVLAFFKQFPVQLHFDFLDGGRDHVCRDVPKLLLNLNNFVKTQTWCIWLVIHLEVSDLLQLVLSLPLHGLLLLSTNCGRLVLFKFLVA
jgi:hypothetical protein